MQRHSQLLGIRGIGPRIYSNTTNANLCVFVKKRTTFLYPILDSKKPTEYNRVRDQTWTISDICFPIFLHPMLIATSFGADADQLFTKGGILYLLAKKINFYTFSKNVNGFMYIYLILNLLLSKNPFVVIVIQNVMFYGFC